MEKVILSISLLVSNRKDTIRKCMESIKPLLCAIPSELIVVDTVGGENSDGSLAVAKEYATKVVHFEWCNDFAAARNAGLSLAIGEWFMFLDDDEWFEDVNEIITFFQNGEHMKYNSATYQIRNYKDATGITYSVAVIGRMIRRQPGLMFKGSIHEAFSEWRRPCKDFQAYVHHFGYVYKTEEEKEAHRERNEKLLQSELDKNPRNMHYRTQMAMELANYDNENALAFCEETLDLCKGYKEENEFQWQLALIFRVYEALGKSVEEVEQKYLEYKSIFGYNDTAELAICYQLVRICLINNKPQLAYPYAVRYFQSLQILWENKELQQKQMIADFKRYQTEEAYLEMLHFGAYSAWKAKQYTVAWNWYECMPWEEPQYKNEEAFHFMVQLFLETREKARVIALIKRVMKNATMINQSNIKNEISLVLNELK